jgi:nucleotide-binding universal stress UspA family protein
MNTMQEPPRMDIMLAVDGSQHALAAAQMLCDLPLPPGSLVKALAVLVPREASNHAMLETALQQTAAIFDEKNIDCDAELLTGYPAEALADYADQFQPDLIALGAKGLRATLGILLGGVVQQVVEYANWPALVVREPYTGLKRILLITDGSVYSQRAMEYLAVFPLPEEVDLRVMHVLQPVISPAMVARSWPVGSEAVSAVPSYETERMLSKQAELEEQDGLALLERTVSHLKAEGLQASSVQLRGDAATEIIDYVKTHHIDLIVAGSRGLSQMKRLLLGSLSRKLVHYAGCSVLIVKGGSV